MKKIFLLLLFLVPINVWAQENQEGIISNQNSNQEEVSFEENFKAIVTEITEEREIDGPSGEKVTQQNLKLKALSGILAGQDVFFQGVKDLEVLSGQVFKIGDRVIMSHQSNPNEDDLFFILDYDRTHQIMWLAIIFFLSVLIIGRWKGIKSLLALVASFFVILKFIIPRILAGNDPVLISVIGGIIILFFSIYLTQGFNKKAHIANLALIASLIVAAFLSSFFTHFAQLTGYAGEETIFLLDTTRGTINLQGLLLAGILIGTLGILDDVIISQVSTVEQIKIANPNLSNLQVYKMSIKVGVDHITSMINTLFFAYAGVSLPLLILFTQSDVLGLNFSQAINNEIIATEIIRTLLGSISIILAIPIANWLASYFLKVKD